MVGSGAVTSEVGARRSLERCEPADGVNAVNSIGVRASSPCGAVSTD